MKITKYILAGCIAAIFAVACNEGIDPITPVDPGEDMEAPAIVITNPSDDVIIPFTDEATSVDIQFEVTDDIEIGSISVVLDGAQLAAYDSFKDYRRVVQSYLHEDLPLGEHSIQVIATDLSGKETTQTFTFEVSNKYVAKYSGEIFYMPFEGELHMDLLSETNATVVGTPGFAAGKTGQAYLGAAGAYLTFPAGGLQGGEFSASFWYRLRLSDPEPAYGQRAGILVMGPPDEANPDAQNVRTNGFRFFREGNATNQTFKLNVGNGTADSWFDGGAVASLNPANATGWVHLAFTISGSECVVYINGAVVKRENFAGVDWTGCDILSIGSGAPRFTGWDHRSDQSLLDELRLFNKALSQTEIEAIFNAGN